VIIPAYNAEEHLEQCVDSILTQGFCNLELILVDNASQDSSGKLCDRFARSDSRVKVIHIESNQGPGKARNAGMEIATGTFLHFIDSDDYIEPDAYGKVISYIEKFPDSIVYYFGHYIVRGEASDMRKEAQGTPPAKLLYTGRESLLELYLDRVSSPPGNSNLNSLKGFAPIAPWSALYRRDFLVRNTIVFPYGKYEDHHFNMDVICALVSRDEDSHSLAVVVVPEYLYDWCLCCDSTSRAFGYHENFYDIQQLRKNTIEKLKSCTVEAYNDPRMIYHFLMGILASVKYAIVLEKANGNVWAKKEIRTICENQYVVHALAVYPSMDWVLHIPIQQRIFFKFMKGKHHNLVYFLARLRYAK
jgi:glycosyltransferase involved in cell wall biosynthesis